MKPPPPPSSLRAAGGGGRRRGGAHGGGCGRAGEGVLVRQVLGGSGEKIASALHAGHGFGVARPPFWRVVARRAQEAWELSVVLMRAGGVNGL